LLSEERLSGVWDLKAPLWKEISVVQCCGVL